jgi:hypothetical protein
MEINQSECVYLCRPPRIFRLIRPDPFDQFWGGRNWPLDRKACVGKLVAAKLPTLATANISGIISLGLIQ